MMSFMITKASPSATVLALVAFSLAALSGIGSVATAQTVTYEQNVRPILKTHCFQCHGEDGNRQGGLDLRLQRLLVLGGESGAGIVPGKPEESLLWQRLSSREMPPDEIQLRPTSEEIAIIQRWIAEGGKTAREEPADLDPDNYLTEEERSFWAFQPIVRHIPPPVQGADRAHTQVDLFLLKRLEDHSISFSADADRQTLLRRAYHDLLGLPPPPDEVDQFHSDKSPDAYEQLLDRLLASPHYGERWGRHWLDVAGYADSEGYTDKDPVREDAYKYRDYVIRAFNSNKPLDEFLLEQLAGDELITGPLQNLSRREIDQLTATGFLRMAPDGTGAKDVDQNLARNEVIAKTVQIVSTSLVGLTVACAQCHNHRYDPISQADYYAFRAIFEPALDWKNWRSPSERRVSLYTDEEREIAAQIEQEAGQIEAKRSSQEQEFIEQTLVEQLAKLPAELREMARQARDTPKDQRTPKQEQLLREYPSVNVSAGSLYLYNQKAADELKKMAEQANEVRSTKPKEGFVRALWEPHNSELPKTFLFHRGDHEQSKQELKAGELSILAINSPVEMPVNDDSLPTSGRRLAYARWLTSGQHPLSARVIVNRIWLHHFSQGLVPNSGNFGALGTPPTHPRLLDWLASELIDSDWDRKRMHRLIMTSMGYRQSSKQRAAANSVDDGNQLYWRMPVKRLEAEALRDSILAASGDLNRKPFGPAVPVMTDRVGQFVIGVENLNAGRPGDIIPMHGEEFRRSIYVQVRRSRPLSVMAPFDLPNTDPNCTRRASSTAATQSLLMMNSSFATNSAEGFARRLQREAGLDTERQVDHAWRIAFAVEPSEDELAEAISFIQEQTAYFQEQSPVDSTTDNKPDPQLEALTSFCQALFSSNHFLYVD